MVLHNNNEPFDADLTYNKGNFYGVFKRVNGEGVEEEFELKRPKYTFDVVPQDEETIKLDPNGNIPLEDESLQSIVIDLPFLVLSNSAPSVVNEKDGSNKVKKRFSSYNNINELLLSYKHWIEDSFRVLKKNDILIFKTQNNITSAKYLATEEWSWLCAEACGFETLDKFTLGAKVRMISGQIKKQQHARNYTSTFWVFKKSSSKKIKYLDCLDEDGKNLFFETMLNSMTKQKK